MLVALISVGYTASAQTCHYGQGEDGLDKDLKALHAAASCQAAYKLYLDCAWGSSADVSRASIVADKCGAAFRAKLSVSQQQVMDSKLQLCADQYAGEDGTLSMSAEATCHVEVVYEFATNLASASKPLPRASFDCSRASTSIEKTICGDPTLGRYDLLMAQSYKTFLREMKGADRAQVIQNQRAWNARTPAACGVTPGAQSPATLACLRKAFHKRLQDLDGCVDAADVGCLQRSSANQ